MSRHRISPILALLLLSVLVNAQITDLSGYKIFINPGHGGFDSNDRYMETTGFWESQGNLVKGLFLRTLLTNMNATVYMSRVTNTTDDDLPLSAISELANAANADFFLSIHSNGFDGTQNRPLMLFRGYDNQPVYPLSKDMASIMWQKVFENGNCWTHSGVYVKGDWSFYPDWGTQGLGVLRGLTMPGVLSEGSFHDYIPESWRLLNNDFLHHESWALARSFLEFWNVVPVPFGVIAGIVRDSTRSPGWYYKQGTRDEALPVNGATVTLMPGSKTYIVDNQNNGFFMFDSLTPGNYKLIVTGVENFMNDTSDISVVAGKSSLAEVFLQFDTTLVPQLTSVTPAFSDSLTLNQEITFLFDLPMDRDSVTKAITFEPEVQLTYSWNEASTVLKVKPAIQFSPETNYTITLRHTACSKWKVRLASDHVFDFVTINRTKLSLLKAFPGNGHDEVSLFPQIRLIFDAPLDPESVQSNIEVSDSDLNVLNKIREELISLEGKGYYRFELANPLALNKSYRIILHSTLADLSTTTLGTTTELNFTTRTTPYPVGSVVETFDEMAHFWDPETSGSTVGTDNPVTVFTSSTQIKKSGTASGKLNYTFITNDGGVCRVFNTHKPSIGMDQASRFGVWVFGDLSNNILEYWFYSSGTINQITFVDTINWAGWDFRSIPFSAIGGSGDRNFHSVVIRQTAGGEKVSVIYFDDAQVFSSKDEEPPPVTAYDMTVYPNPFSTEGNIYVELPEESKVRLQVFSTTGRLISTVVESTLSNGIHPLVWKPTAADPTGLYIFRLEINPAGNIPIKTIIRKGLLIK
jgi:N-acetylmuramoyl-L-alanine amidase